MVKIKKGLSDADMLKGFSKIEAMDDGCVAPDSLAREFIGGSTYDNH